MERVLEQLNNASGIFHAIRSPEVEGGRHGPWAHRERRVTESRFHVCLTASSFQRAEHREGVKRDRGTIISFLFLRSIRERRRTKDNSEKILSISPELNPKWSRIEIRRQNCKSRETSTVFKKKNDKNRIEELSKHINFCIVRKKIISFLIL